MPEEFAKPLTSVEPPDVLPFDSQVMGFLQDLRRNQSILQGIMPTDSPIYPATAVYVSPYYMNASDPDELGAWRVMIDGNEVIDARVTTIPFRTGPQYRVTLRGSDSNLRDATDQESLNIIQVLKHISENTSQEKVEVPRKREVIVKRLRALGSRALRQAKK